MIELSQLTKVYGEDIVAVDQLSLTVGQGEVYGLLGPNGAGKTTTLRMILGLLKPTSGEASILGCRASSDPLRMKQMIGLVSASAGLYQWLTPRELLRYFAIGFGMDEEQARQRTRELSEVMELDRFMDRRCGTLSTGQAQRVNLARALVHDPPVVLLDEPTRGLDVVGAKIVFDYVQFLRQSNKAIIVCTHQLEEAERFCDRFGLLYHGRLRYEGTLAELRAMTGQPSLVEIFLELLRNDSAHVDSGKASLSTP
ncbi:ABC transporter ATP-binding protein [Blastopirellula marina]|uniref:Sodium ABC transporter ATP-binding protein n=1 Tax=Blastopirellula marina TaxID=124 RepID=A0A2S8FPC0_9BACT|nr:ABC transporter ATP-binding protein [Blastopirellula marina]PQO34033.1 sodium ABC transporter ATP-binding protein [Blastopirellula marina]PTL43819.1 ABC transporter ATP-binding protein [Blastopirellula marina]